MEKYDQLKYWRKEEFKKVICDHHQLNQFHDQLMKTVIEASLEKVASEWGKPPAHFAFFVMGSAGRSEQSVWSDQDHGLIYESSENTLEYFLKVGEEITRGLAIVGYERCEGNVMASNPHWCKSTLEWEKQMIEWLEKADWESLRYFSTFFDSRVLFGEEELLLKLKVIGFSKLDEKPSLYKRLYENVGLIKKSIGLFGQLLPEERGEDLGTINLKKTIFFPYVNSLRLLALLEKISQPSTIERFFYLPQGYEEIKEYQIDFLNLLNYRLYFQRNAISYEKVHLLSVTSMSSREKESLKALIRRGRKLFKTTKKIIDQRCSL